jgi:DNA-binding PadR family transcriptional regulator
MTAKLRLGPHGQRDPSLLILTSLSSGAKHGYALLGDIESFAGVRLGPGTLYGAIARLQEQRLIEALEPTGRTRPYALTQAGRESLERALRELSQIVDVATRRVGVARARSAPAGAAGAA